MFRDDSLTGGSATEYHHLELPDEDDLVVRRYVIARPAVVLGSTQPETDLDPRACERMGLEVARRRSGGGAVLLLPGEHLWVDVYVPREHWLWDEDLTRSFRWLGRQWCEVLEAELSPPKGCRSSFEVHDGRLMASRWSAKVCFAGLGPGEVHDGEGSKVVGISQRRTRDWSRFQCVVSLAWRGDAWVELLADPAPTETEAAGWGTTLTSDPGVGAELADRLHSAFVRRVAQLSPESPPG